MKRAVKRIGGAVLALLVLLALWIVFNTYPIWQAYLGKPPVRFRQNSDISLGLYPRGYQAAVVFTNDDFHAGSSLKPVERLRKRLKKLGVAGTFFVVPHHLGEKELEPGTPQVEMLEKLKASGHEIAQHGYLHHCGKNEGRGVKMGAEFLFLSYEEQLERLRRGREILTGLGFPPLGHRSPCFSGTEETFRALDELGFLYGSDIDLPSTTLTTLVKPTFKGNILFPYHPSGLKLLEVTCQNDPTVRKKKVMKILDRFYPRGGAIVILTHLPQAGEEEYLDRLEEFYLEIKELNVWFCRLDELSKWWLARENLDVETEREGDTVVVRYDNPSNLPLKDATIIFKKSGSVVSKYRVIDRAGKIVQEGRIPDNREVNLGSNLSN